MSDINLKCVFCGETTLQKTIKFTLETLKKCINILEYRRSKPVFRKSRTTYDNLELSMESSLNDVYHAQCYKLFTAIKIPRDFQYLKPFYSLQYFLQMQEILPKGMRGIKTAD